MNKQKRYEVDAFGGRTLYTNSIKKARRFIEKHLRNGIDCELADNLTNERQIYYAHNV